METNNKFEHTALVNAGFDYSIHSIGYGLVYYKYTLHRKKKYTIELVRTGDFYDIDIISYCYGISSPVHMNSTIATIDELYKLLESMHITDVNI